MSYYGQWKKLGFPTYTEPMLPTHLTKEERAVALAEAYAMPEQFYTRSKLPVITPENCEAFIRNVSVPALGIFIWSWFSGSSKLLSVAMHLPFLACVLFPIDLRLGWDVRLANVQKQTKAAVGDKTMMDALIPAVDAMQAHTADGIPAMLDAAAKAAAEGAVSTIGMVARFGRARNLGDRVIGHADAGATSTACVFAAFAGSFSS